MYFYMLASLIIVFAQPGLWSEAKVQANEISLKMNEEKL